MRFLSIAAAILTIIGTTNIAQAFPGAVPPGTASAEYDSTTGEIVVSVNNVINWYIESESLGLTGNSPIGLVPSSGVVSDNDHIIGETTGFSFMSYTNIELGRVAQIGLSPSELSISWQAALGEFSQTLPLGYSRGSGPANYSPTAVISEHYSVDIATSPLDITLDASNSTDDGLTQPLSYRWDLDGDGTFEVDTGEDSTYEIADVTETFNGLGRFPVAVEVSDGDFYDVALSTISLGSTIPQGPSRGPGQAPFRTAIAAYDPSTGEIIVSANNVDAWFIYSESESLSDEAPENLPKGGGSVYSREEAFGEWTWHSFPFPLAYNNVSITNIAPAGLPLNDLSIMYFPERGQPTETLPVSLLINSQALATPEPTTLLLAALGLTLFTTTRRRQNVA